MEYPLPERIGAPELLVGRKQEFAKIEKWIRWIHKRGSRSVALLARKKSGKTAIVQRMFNRLWSDNGQIIPFYYEIKGKKIWLPDFATDYFRHFASQYISFLEREPQWVYQPLALAEIRDYGVQHQIDLLISDVDGLQNNREWGLYGQMWSIAYAAPHSYAAALDRRWVVMLDEFQNIAEYVCTDQALTIKDETMAGSYHEHSESKIAPMFVTGSYVGWLVNVVSKYLEAGRLNFWELSPYLESEDGLEAVYRYASFFEEPITNPTAVLINQLCQSDPFFIYCVICSQALDKDLTTGEGVTQTVHYELTQRKTGFARTWAEYIDVSLDRINDLYARQILLFLTKHSDQEWTHREIQSKLNLNLDLKQLLRKLLALVQTDLIEEGTSDVHFRGLRDGTLYLILRNRFQEEVKGFEPELRDDFRQQYQALKKQNRVLQGKLNQLSGKIAEDLLATELRSRKRVYLKDFFEGTEETTEWNLSEVRTRHIIQRSDNKHLEIDVWAKTDDHHLLCVEVKKTQNATDFKTVEDFLEKMKWIQTQSLETKVVAAFLSLGGFTEDAKKLCQENHIGMATRLFFIDHFFE